MDRAREDVEDAESAHERRAEGDQDDERHECSVVAGAHAVTSPLAEREERRKRERESDRQREMCVYHFQGPGRRALSGDDVLSSFIKFLPT